MSLNNRQTLPLRTLPPSAPPPVPRPAGKPWSLPEAAGFLSCSTKHLSRLGHLGEIKLLRIGKRVLIADAELRRLAGIDPPAAG